jgi:hypothetical protein
VYRGFCKSKPAMEEIRKEYLEKELAVHAIIDRESSSFTEFQLKEMHQYIEEFFKILKDAHAFRVHLLEGCRTNK